MRDKQNKRRIAITGIGLVTPLGNTAEQTWAASLSGKSGIAEIESFDARGFPTRIAAEVKDFDAARSTSDRKILKYAGRFNRFALAAAEEAIADCGISPTSSDSDRWACVVGSGMMTVDFDRFASFQRTFAPDGEVSIDKVLSPESAENDPIAFCRTQVNAGISLLLKRFGIRGYASAIHTACASGGQALGTALKVLRRGTADKVLAGGFDSMVNPVGLGAFCLLGALSTDNDQPHRASRPFDRTRNGFVLGEGAGFLVLEDMYAARQRGAHIYAELAGEGTSLSSYRITDSHPSGDGAIQAMRRALNDAGLEPGAVDYINAHGTSTLMNDRSECAAINAVFGSNTAKIRVSSTKSQMGHLVAAAGAVEGAICALAIKHGTLPINANLQERDTECDLNFVTANPARCDVKVALSNSFGFGGSNSTLAFRRTENA